MKNIQRREEIVGMPRDLYHAAVLVIMGLNVCKFPNRIINAWRHTNGSTRTFSAETIVLFEFFVTPAHSADKCRV